MIDGFFEFGDRDLSVEVPPQQVENVLCKEFTQVVPKLLVGGVLKLRERHLADILDFVKAEETVAVCIHDVEE
jgi:hypothetical protein